MSSPRNKLVTHDTLVYYENAPISSRFLTFLMLRDMECLSDIYSHIRLLTNGSWALVRRSWKLRTLFPCIMKNRTKKSDRDTSKHPQFTPLICSANPDPLDDAILYSLLSSASRAASLLSTFLECANPSLSHILSKPHSSILHFAPNWVTIGVRPFLVLVWAQSHASTQIWQ